MRNNLPWVNFMKAQGAESFWTQPLGIYNSVYRFIARGNELPVCGISWLQHGPCQHIRPYLR